MRARVFAEPVLLLLLLFDRQARNSGPLKNTMGLGTDDWDGTVDLVARTFDMEHESICGRLQQLGRLGRENV